MGLSPTDREFFEKRGKRVKHWPLYDTFSLAILAVYCGELNRPDPVNSWMVSERLEAGSLFESMMARSRLKRVPFKLFVNENDKGENR